uniref:Uncharacterized protein n=1 Tax=Cacopsylla melanoneura TaxID=428564 RepID=A0A8D8W3J1_9HEMI
MAKKSIKYRLNLFVNRLSREGYELVVCLVRVAFGSLRPRPTTNLTNEVLTDTHDRRPTTDNLVRPIVLSYDAVALGAVCSDTDFCRTTKVVSQVSGRVYQ